MFKGSNETAQSTIRVTKREDICPCCGVTGNPLCCGLWWHLPQFLKPGWAQHSHACFVTCKQWIFQIYILVWNLLTWWHSKNASWASQIYSKTWTILNSAIWWLLSCKSSYGHFVKQTSDSKKSRSKMHLLISQSFIKSLPLSRFNSTLHYSMWYFNRNSLRSKQDSIARLPRKLHLKWVSHVFLNGTSRSKYNSVCAIFDIRF